MQGVKPECATPLLFLTYIAPFSHHLAALDGVELSPQSISIRKVTLAFPGIPILHFLNLYYNPTACKGAI